MSHTPGPWVCDSEKDMFDTDERTWIVTAADGTFLAAGIPWDRESDARLIAAAPGLLAACRHLMTYWRYGTPVDGGSEAADMVVAAVAKAEGRAE